MGNGQGRRLSQSQRGLAEQSSPDLALPFDVSQYPMPAFAQASNDTDTVVVILAPNRTKRVDPLNHLQYYTGGWDFFAGGYWGSLTWASIYGGIIGIAWALFGLGFLAVLLITCLCCHQRWHHLRDDSLQFEKSQLTLPLVFMILGLIISGTGFGLSIAGVVIFRSAANNATEFIVQEATGINNILGNMTSVLAGSVSYTRGQFNQSLAPEVEGTINGFVEAAQNVSATLKSSIEDGGGSVRYTLKVLQQIIFIFATITFGLCLIAIFCALLQWVTISNVCTCLIWVLIVASWILVTVFVFVWLFEGDTSVAMQQIALNPSLETKFNKIVACADPAVTGNIAALGRYVGALSVAILNGTLSANHPRFWRAIARSPGGLCQPFLGPLYRYDNRTCNTPPPPCFPSRQKCKPRTISLANLIQLIPYATCNATTGQNLTCLTVEEATAIYAAQAFITNLDSVMEPLQKLFRCQYIAYLANHVSALTGDLESGTLYLWLGFMLIALGSMIFAVCLPIYAYRTVRCYDDGYYYDKDSDEDWAQEKEQKQEQHKEDDDEGDEDDEDEDEEEDDDDDHDDDDDDDDDDHEYRDTFKNKGYGYDLEENKSGYYHNERVK